MRKEEHYHFSRATGVLDGLHLCLTVRERLFWLISDTNSPTSGSSTIPPHGESPESRSIFQGGIKCDPTGDYFGS